MELQQPVLQRGSTHTYMEVCAGGRPSRLAGSSRASGDAGDFCTRLAGAFLQATSAQDLLAPSTMAAAKGAIPQHAVYLAVLMAVTQQEHFCRPCEHYRWHVWPGMQVPVL